MLVGRAPAGEYRPGLAEQMTLRIRRFHSEPMAFEDFAAGLG